MILFKDMRSYLQAPSAFFVASFSLSAASVAGFLLDISYPIPIDVLNLYRGSAAAMVLGAIVATLVLVGLAAFVLGLIRTVTGLLEEAKDHP